jgi:electron transport complex protein RnfD
MTNPSLIISASPHLRGADSTPKIMWTVVVALVPVMAASSYFFGLSALLVTAAATGGAVVTEHFLIGKGTIRDGSAVLTGVLLGLTLPAGMPMWMAFLGSVFGIAFGKALFGGLGYNIFNPALLGRAFLQAAFPVAITTWPALHMPWAQLRGDNFAFPLMSAKAIHAVTAATPLGSMKFEQQGTNLFDLMVGQTGGSLGETAGLIILACGAWLAWRRVLNWRIPVSIILSVGVFAQVLHLVNATKYPGPFFQIFAGGLLLGAVFMATDPVTCPMTELGRWIFGAGIGVLTVVIRLWGGLPEGVMYAILIMNAFSPAIGRLTQPRVFGTAHRAAAKS